MSESGWKGTAATTSKNGETARYYSRLKEFMEAGKARDWGDSLRSATTAEVVTDAAGGVPLCHTRAARPETRRD